MTLIQKLVLPALFSALCVATSSAQSPKIPEIRNAALRYWIAFADLQDLPADKETQNLLERTAAGEIPFDEAKLGPIVEKNEDAILGMQRATSLPECDWGLEYSRGPRASVAPMVKARILARLNTLYGFRQAARGDFHGAMKTWLAGTKFSQDLARGGTLIFVLIARSALLSNLNAIKVSAEQGKLPADARKQALAALQNLAPTGFDWGDTWQMETYVIQVGWDSTLKAQDPREAYKAITGEELKADSVLPSPSDLTLFRRFMDEVSSALKLSPGDATKKLSTLRDREKSLNPLLQNSIPNFDRVNANRSEVQTLRDAAIRALNSGPQS
jgi:hypothetical protein